MEPLGVAGLAMGLVTFAQSTMQLVRNVSTLNQLWLLFHRDHSSSDKRFQLDVDILLHDAQVDIVFIHGLEGSRGEGEVKFSYWEISHLLSANILVYSYDTTLRSSEFLLGRTLLHEGIQLIRRLVHLRTNKLIKKRPIIFVAHSLGGILLKNALVLSEMSSSKDEKEICRSTMGIVFLNTPQEKTPDSFAASIWNIAQPNLHPETLQDPKWQKRDFYIRARSLAYHTNCFEPIIRDLIIPPIYLNIDTSDLGHSGFGNSQNIFFGALRSIIEQSNSPEYRQGHVSPQPNARVAVHNEVFRGFKVVKSLPGVNFPTKQATSPWGLSPFKLDFGSYGSSKSSYSSIFLIKATNRASIGLSCLNICREILLHYSSQIGSGKAEELLGIKGIHDSTDSKILSQPEMLASIVEAVAHWLRKPQNNHWLLIIDDMPMEEKDFTLNVARMDRSKDSTLMFVLNAMFMLRQSSDSDCQIICTPRIQDTKKGIIANEGELICPCSALQASRCSNPGLGGMDEVIQRILRLCITLSDESTRGITTEVIHQCDDLIANTVEPATAKSKTEDALQYLKESGVLELWKTRRSRIEFLRVHKSIKKHCLSPPGPSNRDEIILAWACLEKTVRWTLQQKGSMEQWDLGSSLVESCSAVVRRCYEIQASLESLGVNSILLGELCERHSAYSTAATLYESAYSQRRPRPCEYEPSSFSFHVEAAHKLARIYFLSGVMDKAEEKSDETIKLIGESHKASKVLLLDAFRLDAALNAAKGNLETATKRLEKLLEDLSGYDRDSDARGDSIDDYAAFLSVARDLANYLVHSGDYKKASLLLQRALLSQKRRTRQNQPILLALHEAMAILYRRQGEPREAESHYLDAHAIINLWVGDRHPYAALNLASRAVAIGLQGRNKEATGLFKAALGKARFCLGIQQQEVCHIQELLVLCLAAGGHYESAITELLELEQNLNSISGDSIRTPMTRVRHHKKSLENSKIGRGDRCHKDQWLKELELVEDEVSGNRRMIFLERQNELLSSFFFHSF